jgi:hypothetical protein
MNDIQLFDNAGSIVDAVWRHHHSKAKDKILEKWLKIIKSIQLFSTKMVPNTVVKLRNSTL